MKTVPASGKAAQKRQRRWAVRRLLEGQVLFLCFSGTLTLLGTSMRRSCRSRELQPAQPQGKFSMRSVDEPIAAATEPQQKYGTV